LSSREITMLQAIPVPALSNNYVWLVRAGEGTACVVVDPGEASATLAGIEQHGLEPAAILITHRHHDHVGGLSEVSARFPEAPVYGPAQEPVAGVQHLVRGGDRVAIAALDTTFEVIATPGHTTGHIAYYGGGVLLCGDTLFAGGCGRVFEGTASEMAASLARLAALPDETLGCGGHEYTLKNLAFALAVEPDNAALIERERAARATREADQPTLPFTLRDEHATNPFLRCEEPAVRAAAEQHAGRELDGPDEVFGALREWKNRF
jgi:hydroxyacylglutathione hydrolase